LAALSTQKKVAVGLTLICGLPYFASREGHIFIGRRFYGGDKTDIFNYSCSSGWFDALSLDGQSERVEILNGALDGETVREVARDRLIQRDYMRLR